MVKWTPEQEQVINYRQEKELLVSAAAGSGKTTVMSARILDLCIQAELEPDNLVVLTFTDKAAANMRKSIEKSLRKLKEAETDPDKRARLLEIEESIDLAQVSTIHSFCLRIIKEYKHLLLDPQGELLYPQDLKTLDAEEANLLLAEAIEEIFAEVYDLFLADSDLADLLGSYLAGEISKEDLQVQVELFDQLEEGWRALVPQPIKVMPVYSWFKNFVAVQEISGSKKSDEYFKEQIGKDYKYLRSLPDYRQWLIEEYQHLVEDTSNFIESESARFYLSQDKIGKYIFEAYKYIDEIDSHPYISKLMSNQTSKEAQAFQELYPGLKAHVHNFVSQYPPGTLVENLPAEEREEVWNYLVEMGRAISDFPLLRKDNRVEDKMSFRDLFYGAFAGLIQLVSGHFNPENELIEDLGLGHLRQVFLLRTDEIAKMAPRMLEQTAVYLDILALVDDRYQELKVKRQAIDFSDYEHLALDLVRRPEVQESMSGNYEEVLIDEYQDSNPLQEAILQALGLERITMLGDIKQSIYRFRHAAPYIFNHKVKTYVNVTEVDLASLEPGQAAQADGDSALILLNKNFRSRPGLIDGINSFFYSFLREETGDINYDVNQALLAGQEEESFQDKRPHVRKDGPPIRFKYTLTEKNQGPKEDEDDDDSQVIYKLVDKASKLDDLSAQQLSLLESVLELQNEGYSAHEIAILARTHKLGQKAQVALAAIGIESELNLKTEFINSPELRLLKSLVQILANEEQDIPLVALMRSELLGPAFTEAELLQIAQINLDLETSEDPEHQAHLHAIQKYKSTFLAKLEDASLGKIADHNLADKCASFIRKLNQAKFQSAYLSIGQTLERVIEDSNWLDSLAAMPFGQDRLKDVEEFIRLAENFTKNNPHDLAAFARYLEQVEKKKIELEELDPEIKPSSVINIMTMHASKGLEFPAVIYFGSEATPKKDSPRNTRSFSAQLGIAANLPGDELIYMSPRKLYFQDQEDFQTKAEVYRLLYVAMTRAEEVLYIPTGGSEDAFARLTKLARRARASSQTGPQGTRVLDQDFLKSLKNDLQLIYAWLALEFPELGSVTELSDELDFSDQEKLVEFATYTRRLERLSSMISGQDKEELAKPELYEDLAFNQEAGPGENGQGFGFDNIQSLENLLSPDLPGDEKRGLIAKLTVTEIQKQANLEDDLEEGAVNQIGQSLEGIQEMALQLRSPSFLDPDLSQTALSAADYGTLLHYLFQHLPLEAFYEYEPGFNLKANASELYTGFLKKLKVNKALSEKDLGKAVQAYDYVGEFLRSGLAQRIALAGQEGNFVARELPFTLAIPAIGLDDPGDEITLVQGMIDLFFDEDDSVVLVDYKSDNLDQPQYKYRKQEVLEERYFSQLNYYAEAIERLRGKKVKEIYIWAIREGREYKIDRKKIL